MNRMDWHILFNEFAKHFVYYILRTIRNYQNHMKDTPEDPEISLPKKGVSAAVSMIPYLGRGLAAGVDQLFKRNARQEGKEKAEKSIEMVNLYEVDSHDFIKLLTEAAFDVFFAYSQQFSTVTARAGRLRAMQKLGLDAGERFVSSVKDDKIEGKLTVDLVTKGVVFGKSKQHQYMAWVRGRKLIITETGEVIRTADFFDAIGVCLQEGGDSKCFVKKSCNAHRYLGCRRLFPWENVTEVKTSYKIEERPCQYRCEINVENKKAYIENAYAIVIKNTSPYEDLKISIDSSLENKQKEVSSNAVILANIKETIVDFSEINRAMMKQNCRKFREMINHDKRQCFLYSGCVRSSMYRYPDFRGISVC